MVVDDFLWSEYRLGDVCEKIGSGATPRGGSSVYIANGVALIRSQNIYNDRFSTNGLAFIDEVHASELENVTVEEGDILLNITGDSVARVNCAPSYVLPARVNQHVSIIRPNKDVFDKRYLYYYFASPSMQEYMLALASGGGTRNALTKGMIEDFRISAPSLPEQQAIARILGALDDKIELSRRMNHTLEEMSRSLFKSWFVDFDPVTAKAEGRVPFGMNAEPASLFPTEFEETEEGIIPKGWMYVKIGEVMTNFDSRRVPLSGSQRLLRQGVYPYYGAASIMDYIDDYLFDGIYLLVGEDGSVEDKDGMAVTQYAWGKFWVNNHAHVLQGINGISTEHIYIHYKFEPISPYITGAVQPKVNQGNLNSMPFLLPSKEVAEAFTKIITPWFARVRANQDEIKTLAAIRDALLPKLLSGELRVKS